MQPRIKPGVAIAITRECLAALAARPREAIVHGDVKPSNIMVKRTGNAKIIDIGSAMDLNNMPQQKTCTPQYAAPEVLDREEVSPRSDLCSLGYVLVELLAGKRSVPIDAAYFSAVHGGKVGSKAVRRLIGRANAEATRRGVPVHYRPAGGLIICDRGTKGGMSAEGPQM